jgi:DMSO reductase anchor subunit
MLLVALALFLFWLMALVARVRHGREMWWLKVAMYYGRTRVWTTSMVYENQLSCLCVLKICYISAVFHPP